MKKFFILVLSLCSLSATYSQEHLQDHISVDSLLVDSVPTCDTVRVVLITDVMENAIIYQDSLVRQLMIDRYLGIERGQIEKSGFRVQVYSSNQQQVAKNEALLLQQDLENKLDKPVYTLSEPPFWKVRIGNFLTREEAMEYREIFIRQFPDLQGGTYIVPDQIIIVN